MLEAINTMCSRSLIAESIQDTIKHHWRVNVVCFLAGTVSGDINLDCTFLLQSWAPPK
jgi:hypothetical protein